MMFLIRVILAICSAGFPVVGGLLAACALADEALVWWSLGFSVAGVAAFVVMTFIGAPGRA